MIPPIQDLLITESESVRAAIQVIDKNAQGVCFVVNAKKILVGILTDGDVRRAFLQGKHLDSPLHEVMQRAFTALHVDTPQDEILRKLNDKIRHIPLVDDENIPVDFACTRKLRRIPIMEPLLAGNELNYVTDCIKTNWISSQGKYVKGFEKIMADFHDCPYALAVSNGTVALHLALIALGIGPGDEVIVPDLTFAASINSIVHAGATPVIVDIKSNDWNIDPLALEAAITPKTKAIMPVHLYGYACDMEPILAIAKKHQLYVVEDNAEALGSTYNGQLTGTFGEVATYSFFGNKTVTTGEGGLVLFKEKAHYEKAVIMRDHGMSRTKKYWHDFIGYNYRMTNLQAAIGLAQMERIDEILKMKLSMAAFYNENLKDIDSIELPPETKDRVNTHWLYTILLKEDAGIDRDQLIQKLLQNGIEARPVFFPLHVMPPYQSFANGSFPNTNRVSKQGLSLPSFVHLKKEDQQAICDALRSILGVQRLMETK